MVEVAHPQDLGMSRYNEFQLLALFNSQRFRNWNISYVCPSTGQLKHLDNFLAILSAFSCERINTTRYLSTSPIVCSLTAR